MKGVFKRALRAATALALAGAMLTGCTLTERLATGEETVQTGTVAGTDARKNEYFGLAYYAGELVNPVLSVSRMNRLLVEGLYEGLFVLDNNFTPQPVLCESYSGDGTQYTFRLKSGVKFWSGEPLTAQDVVYSYETVRGNAASPYYDRMVQVRSLKAVDALTVQITLNTPNTSFPALLDIPIFRKGTETGAFSDGTGPLQPQSDGSARWLIPFAGWHGGAVTAYPKIELVSMVRADAMQYSFETGDISMTRADRISAEPQTFQGAVEVFQTPTTELHYLGVNCGHAPYQLPAVRQAVSAALDRAGLCATQLQTFGSPAVLPVYPQPQQSSALTYSIERDEERALAALASVGVSDTDGDGVLDYADASGRRVPLAPVILVNSENAFKVETVKQIVASLEQLGIRATISAVSFEEYQNALQKGNYDLYYASVRMTPDFDLRPLIGTGGALAYGGCASTETDAMIASARAASGDALQAARDALYNRLLETMPVIPVAFARSQIILRSGLVGNYSAAPYAAFYNLKDWET